MVGIYGVFGDTDVFAEPSTAMYWEDWYEAEQFDTGEFDTGIVTHGGRDPEGFTTWTDGDRVGLLYGVLPNREELGWSIAETFERILDEPAETLHALDGPFFLAVVDGDADRAIVATDKMGSRAGYYTTDGQFAFGTELKSLVPLLSEPKLNQQAASDILLLNWVWGEKTLVEGVNSVQPGHYVEFDDGDVSTEAYWRFDYDSQKSQRFVDDLARKYRNSIEDMAGTIDGNLGVWLSGGLDSRSIAGVLKDSVDQFETYTYVRPLAHPKRIGQDDLDLAPVVAEHLDVPNEEVSLSPDRFAEVLPQCVDLVDGMLAWTSLTNLAAVFELPSENLDVMLEGSGQSELLGEGMWRYHLDASNYDDPTEPLVQRHGRMPVEQVRELLGGAVEPMQTLTDEVASSPEFGFENVVRDTNNRSLLSNAQFLSNKLTQSQTGTRHPFASGELLEHIGKQHADYRMNTLPFTKGKIPVGYSPIKIELIRALGGGLEDIPYDHTNLAPKYPFTAHTAGFVTQQVVNRTLGSPVTANWYTESDALRETINGLLEDAADRDLWDSTAVTEVLNGLKTENWGMMHAAAAITTVELWAQRHLDPVAN